MNLLLCENSRKKEDMETANAISNLLDLRLYPRLREYWSWGEYERVYDLDKQYAGIDVTLTKKSGIVINIDEKAQVYYINKNLPTFAFELDFIDAGGRRKNGWFVDCNNKTDYYLLVYPYATNTNTKTLKMSEITKLECYMISKNKIKWYLNDIGFGEKELIEKARELRREHKYGKTLTNCENVSFYYSSPEKYKEEPINVVLRRTVIRELCDRYYVVDTTIPSPFVTAQTKS